MALQLTQYIPSVHSISLILEIAKHGPAAMVATVPLIHQWSVPL